MQHVLISARSKKANKKELELYSTGLYKHIRDAL